jgi:molecular chaperone GrpE
MDRDTRKKKAEQAKPEEMQQANAAASEPVEGRVNEEASVDPVMEMNQLKDELDSERKKSQENLDGWQRERADFSNYKKRIERDQAALASNMRFELIKKYLVVNDDLDRALKNRPTEGEGAKWSEGIELVSRKLKSILDAEGLQPIQAQGQIFDPILHEAITHEDSPDHESGQIIEVVQQGYMLGERVLRPALVRVAR